MRRLLIAFSALVTIVATLTVFSISASASAVHAARASAARQTCLPAISMTGAERAAIGTLFRRCTSAPAPGIPATSFAPASPPPVDSLFNFCNDSLACFTANLHFVDRDHFTLSEVYLKKEGGDNRATYADVTDGNGFLGEFKNPNANTTVEFEGPISFYDPYGVSYVVIKLYDCNTFTCSSVALSRFHNNPYY
jgi:hypothetical protein